MTELKRDLLAGGDLITLSLQVRLPANTLAYRVRCTLIADLPIKKYGLGNDPCLSPVGHTYVASKTAPERSFLGIPFLFLG